MVLNVKQSRFFKHPDFYLDKATEHGERVYLSLPKNIVVVIISKQRCDKMTKFLQSKKPTENL